MNDEQRRMAGLAAQPEGTGPFFRNPALALIGVAWLHGTRAAWSCEKNGLRRDDHRSVNRP